MKLRTNIYLAFVARFFLALIIFWLCRIIFYIYNLSYFEGISFSSLLNIWCGGLVFDFSVLLLLHLPYTLSQLLPFKFRTNRQYQKVTLWLHIIPVSLGILANLADTVYYQVTLKRTTGAVFQQFENETNMSKLAMQFLIDYWYMLLLAIILINGFIFITRRIEVKSHSQLKWLPYLGVHAIFLVLGAGICIAGIRGGVKHSTRPITLSNASKYIDKPNQRAIVLNTPFSILRSAGSKPLPQVQYFDSIEEQERIYSAFHSSDDNPDSLFVKKNVVLFILESFGREHIGALNRDIVGYQGFTPFLDSLIDHSHAYKHAFANGRKSISGMPSSIASIPSLVEPFILSHYSGNRISSLASTLKKKDYYTAFFHGAPNGSMGFDAFARQASFDDYFGMTEYGNNEDFDGMWGIWDEEFFQYYAEKLDEVKKPFFTSLFSVSSHHPFKLPARYQNTFPEGNLPIQETIGYTDYSLRKFFKTVKKTSWYENTIFVITADHAATFSDLKEYKTPSGFFAVPIIIFDPSSDSVKPLDETTAVQQIDIMPTVLEMIGYPDDYIAFGPNMLDSTKSHFAVGHMSGNYHTFSDSHLLQFDGDTTKGYYNYLEDRLFQNNLVGEADSTQAEMLQFSKAFIQEYTRRMIKDEMSVSN